MDSHERLQYIGMGNRQCKCEDDQLWKSLVHFLLALTEDKSIVVGVLPEIFPTDADQECKSVRAQQAEIRFVPMPGACRPGATKLMSLCGVTIDKFGAPKSIRLTCPLLGTRSIYRAPSVLGKFCLSGVFFRGPLNSPCGQHMAGHCTVIACSISKCGR